jgi:hypothetical protein
MSAGWGIVPYGSGDWGSLNTIIPETGGVTTQHGWGTGVWNGSFGWGEPDLNTSPGVARGTIITPATGAVSIAGAAPAVALTRFVTPSTGSLSLAGVAPTVRRAFFITPAVYER